MGKRRKTVKSSAKMYMVMDGRAAFDIDNAQILETLGEFTSDDAAKRKAIASWRGMDVVVVSWEQTETELKNPEVVAYAEDLV